MTGRVLADEIGAAAGAGHWTRRAGLLAIGVALMWVSAKVKVPLEPTPVTMQTLVVMAIGMAYGARLGAATMIAYLALGVAGEPVFAGTPEKGVGIVYMAGATGGYLFGFVAAAALVGRMAELGWDRSFLKTAGAMTTGLATLYACGAAWLAFGFPITAIGSSFAGIGAEKAIAFGVAPFVLVDALKLALAVVAFPALRSLMERRG